MKIQKYLALVFYFMLLVYVTARIGLEYQNKNKISGINPSSRSEPADSTEENKITKATHIPNDGIVVVLKYDSTTGNFVQDGGVATGILEAKGFTPDPQSSGMFIPALKPGQSYDLLISKSEAAEAGITFESGYGVEIEVQILKGYSDYFAVFQTNSQHENIYESSAQNELYAGDAELYCTTSGMGLFGDYHGGNLITGETVRLRTHIAFENHDIPAFKSTRLAKYVNDRYVGIQYVKQIERFKLNTSEDTVTISFFCDNNNETLPCIVSEIIIR